MIERKERSNETTEKMKSSDPKSTCFLSRSSRPLLIAKRLSLDCRDVFACFFRKPDPFETNATAKVADRRQAQGKKPLDTRDFSSSANVKSVSTAVLTISDESGHVIRAAVALLFFQYEYRMKWIPASDHQDVLKFGRPVFLIGKVDKLLH